MANFIFYLLQTIEWIIWLYSIIIVIDAILSWVPTLHNTFVGKFLDAIVNPYIYLFRRGPIAKLAFSTGIDISPLIGLLLLYFIQRYVLRWLFNILFSFIG